MSELTEQPRYENFDITITKQTDNIYTISAKSVGGEDSVSNQTFPFDSREFEDLLVALDTRTAKLKHAETVGGLMGEHLFPRDIWALFTKSLADSVSKSLRIRLHIEPPEISMLPWEYCFDKSYDFFALRLDTPIVRYIDLPFTPVTTKVPEPAKVLLFAANPKGYDKLDVKAEADQICEELQGLNHIEVHILYDATWNSLRSCLNDFEPHILHFIGHGKFDTNSGHGKLVLDDGKGDPDEISAWLFANQLRDRGVKVVVLNACETAAHSSSNPFMGIAPALVRAEIPAVIAMQFAITDQIARRFSQRLYSRLALGKPLDISITKARKDILDYDEVRWGIPVLFTRAPDCVIWQPAGISDASTTWEKAASNPFIYGPPVQPDKFLDRDVELRTIFSRLCTGQSTAVTGGPHIGKTSLLRKLADQTTQQEYLSNDVRKKMMVCPLNLHHINSNYFPATFWEKSLKLLRTRFNQNPVTQWLEQIAQDGYKSESLEDLFSYLYEQGQCLILLLDEFERLLEHPNFQNFSFFATIRALDAFPSFSFITASRISLEEQTKRCKELPGSGGSSPFNTQIEIQLPTFDEDTVNALLNRAGKALSPGDRHFIRCVAGRHPYLVQAMAASILETTGDDRHARAAKQFYNRTFLHFNELWDTLEDRSRTAAVILSLMDLGSYAPEQDFDYSEIEKVDAFGFALEQLAELGLAKRMDKELCLGRQNLPLWRGKQWTMEEQAFAWWVRDVVIAKTRAVSSCDKWLAERRYRCLLTQEQWNNLLDTVRGAPEWEKRGARSLAQELFETLNKRKQT